MTNAPVAGWYHDPQTEGQYRYWDGARWTEHVAAPAAAVAPAPVPAPQQLPFAGFGAPPSPPHATLYSNPYQLPARSRRRDIENALSPKDRVRAAAIDAALVVPFLVLGFALGPLLGWIGGNTDSRHHAYHVAGIVIAVILGLGTLGWNFLMRETTLGTAVMARRSQHDVSGDQAS